MERAFGLEIPQSLEDACDPRRVALIMYDMQVGILRHIERSAELITDVVRVLEAARQAGVRVFCMRHMSLPKELMGVFQLRMAMAWQRAAPSTTSRPGSCAIRLIFNSLWRSPRSHPRQCWTRLPFRPSRVLHWISPCVTAGSILLSWLVWPPKLASSRPCAMAVTSATFLSSSLMRVEQGIQRQGTGH
jgi:hypothetical protein